VVAAPAPLRLTSEDPWGRALEAASSNRRLRVLLNECRLVRVENDVVVLAVNDALRSAAQASEKELAGLLATAWDRAVRLEFQQVESAPAVATPQTPRESISEHPLVKQATAIFGAKLLGVQPRRVQGEGEPAGP